MLKGISINGFKRLSKVYSSSILEELQILEDSDFNIFWRFQPKGAEIIGHKSMDYNGEGEVNGVWAFVDLKSALKDMYKSDSYINQVEEDGDKAELIGIEGTLVQDGPDDSVLILEGFIISRFNTNKVMNDEKVKGYIDEDLKND